MNVQEKAIKILQQPVCDNCLGRQFGQLLSDSSNKERGRAVRTVVAMAIDRSKEEQKECGEKINVDMSNFHGFKFHNLEAVQHERKKCSVCGDFFLEIDKWVNMAVKHSKGFEFKTFLIGTKLPFEMISAEESLWERVGIDFCEPLKAEINREVGKLLEKRLKAKFSKAPDINIILNIAENTVHIEPNPLFIYGEYQKLVRGIPQTKWPSAAYKTSVEQLIAKPYMAASKAAGHKLHGLGREDIDARCLGWRPFVLELIRPKKRDIGIKALSKKIDKRVKIRNVRLSDIVEVRRIKESKADKTYSVIVECEKPVTKKDLEKLKHLKDIRQKTPKRVVHRRADRYRNRAVKSLKAQLLNNKKFRLTVRCESGLYVKELISGDDGRTEPSVSSILGVPCTPNELDIIAIHAKSAKKAT